MAASSESEKLQRMSKIGSMLVALALVLTLGGSWFASSRPVAAIDHKKLGNYQESLQSYAHESLFIEREYEHSRSLANYTAISAQKLYDATSSLTLALQTELPEPGLEGEVAQAADQAARLSGILSSLSKAAEEGTKSTVSAQLQTLVQELQQS